MLVNGKYDGTGPSHWRMLSFSEATDELSLIIAVRNVMEYQLIFLKSSVLLSAEQVGQI